MSAGVTIDDSLHQTGDSLSCVYSTDSSQMGSRIIVETRNGKAVWLTVPAAGFVIFERGDGVSENRTISIVKNRHLIRDFQ